MEPMDKDPVLIDFFASMKSKDLKIKVPEFPQQKRKVARKIWMASLGIAASMLLGILIITGRAEEKKLLNDQITITLFEDAQQGTTYFKVTETSSINTWEPATQSLLDEL